MKNHNIPGGYDEKTSKFELDYWENYGGTDIFDLHLSTYSSYFPILKLDFGRERILDIGSGAVSVFEKYAPDHAKIVAYDLLADDYNRIAPDKKFTIQDQIPEEETFSLITLFNMIDHVINPAEILEFANQHLEDNGRLWLAVHLYQPHGPIGHPQNFSCSSIVDLISIHFRIRKCSVIREGIPVPYLWVAELSQRDKQQSFTVLFMFKLMTYFRYAMYQSSRAAVKLMKRAGLQSLLPQQWQF